MVTRAYWNQVMVNVIRRKVRGRCNRKNSSRNGTKVWQRKIRHTGRFQAAMLISIKSDRKAECSQSKQYHPRLNPNHNEDGKEEEQVDSQAREL